MTPTRRMAELSHQVPEDSTATRQELARGGTLSFFGAGVSAVFGLLVIIVLGRTLGDEGAGIVVQTIAIFTIALGVARFGMDSTALWILPRLHDDQPGQVSRTAWFLVAVSGIIGAICAGILLLGVTLYETHTGEDPLISAVRVTAPFLPAAAMLLTALSSTRALGRVTAYVWVGNVALPVMRPVAILGAVGIGAGLTGAATAWALPLVLALVLAFFVLFACTRQYGTGEAFIFRQERLAQRSLLYALPRVASATLEQLLIWVSVLGVGTLLGASAAGIYGAASRFIAAGLIVDAALRVVVSPMFSRMHNRGSSTELTTLYRTATVWLVLFSTPVFVLLAIFAPVALSIIGPEFTSGDTVLMIMCAGALATFFAGNVHSVLLMSGRSGLAALNKLIVVAVTITLIVILTPILGIAGAAIAWSFASMLDAALAATQVRVLLKLRISVTAGLYPFLVGAVSVGVPGVLFRTLMGPTWAGLAAAIGVGAVCFLCWCRTDRTRLQLGEFAMRVRREPTGRRSRRDQ